MNDETFSLLLKQLKEFPARLKSINFAGVGEPLLHKQLPYMIRELKRAGVTESITIITNGIALNENLSLALVDAGVDDLRISLNGLTSKSYLENCGAYLDFDQFLAQIKFLYNNKQKMLLGVKILDSCLGNASESDFYKIFGNYCDKMAIEKTVPLFENLDYDNIVIDKLVLSRYNLWRSERIDICATPFFRMAIRSTGKIMICLPYNGLTSENMDIRKHSIYEIWNGSEHQQIMLNVLRKIKTGITDKCGRCVIRDDFAFKEDSLDKYADELIERVKGTHMRQSFNNV
jgi:MoaA/NifB/PqqE/SkfB family radical SAM enzyme